MSQQYQILVTGPDLHLSTQLPRAKFEELMKLLITSNQESELKIDDTNNSLPTSESQSEVKPVSQPNDLALVEYFNQAQAIRTPDKIATFGLYSRTILKQENFSKNDLLAAFEQAREVAPKNLTRDLSWTVKIGWIAPSNQQPGSYYLTRAGEEAVLAKFPRELKKKTSIHRLK